MNYLQSEKYLKALGNEVLAMKLGLENIQILLDALGNPQTKYLKVQIAGTNGKGSTCAFLEGICLAAGIKVGVNTSPHLVSYSERIRLGGVDISKKNYAKLATRIRKTSESLVKSNKLPNIPTFFEQVTAAALLAFAEAGVELAIIETGLGGRLDATTAARAEYAAVTRIDLDHQKQLGRSLKKIATEKAAIIHEGTIAAVVGEQRKEAMTAIRKVFRDRKIKPKLVSKTRLPAVKLGLEGSHQHENAKIAVRLAESLRSHFIITDEHIAEGLENARHAGRLEYVGRFLFDGAHNASGAVALKKYLDDSVSQPITLIFGAMRDKKVERITKLLFPLASKIVLTEPSNERALQVKKLLRLMPKHKSKENVFVTQSTGSAVELAETVTPAEGIILVTGSLYLVGEVKTIVQSPMSRVRQQKLD